jgi:hypothetical protein
LIWRTTRDGRVVVVQAEGRDDLDRGTALGERPLPPIDENFGDASDLFPGSGGVTRCEDRAAGLGFENIELRGDHVLLDALSLDGAWRASRRFDVKKKGRQAPSSLGWGIVRKKAWRPERSLGRIPEH